jgi:hypothetical protein
MEGRQLFVFSTFGWYLVQVEIVKVNEEVHDETDARPGEVDQRHQRYGVRTRNQLPNQVIGILHLHFTNKHSRVTTKSHVCLIGLIHSAA